MNTRFEKCWKGDRVHFRGLESKGDFACAEKYRIMVSIEIFHLRPYPIVDLLIRGPGGDSTKYHIH